MTFCYVLGSLRCCNYRHELLTTISTIVLIVLSTRDPASRLLALGSALATSLRLGHAPQVTLVTC
ncbi:MAG: hypothetical protein AAB388_02515 [Patescibacteria group bacterium]